MLYGGTRVGLGDIDNFSDDMILHQVITIIMMIIVIIATL